MKDQISIERVKQLHPKVIERFKAFIDEIERVFNTTFRVVQGFRSFAEQDVIFNQFKDGKDNDGDGKIDESDEKVTKVRGGLSCHNYGLAIDIVEMKNGKPNWKFDYSKLESYAQKYGIKWGWRLWGFDNDHFHVDFGFKVKALLHRYSEGDLIQGTHFLNL